MSASFGPYLLLEKLAEGGVGEIFLARRAGGDPVVLKKLRTAVRQHPSARHRLIREAHLVSALDHPNIARVLDAGFVEETFYLTYELVRGETLAAMIKAAAPTDGVPRPIALSIACAVLDALDHAHRSRDAEGASLELVHRDVSSANVMIRRDGVVKLIDFGVAHAQIDSFQTAPGTILGTPLYMSPEQIANAPIDARADLYSVGALLYEALNGVHAVPVGPLLTTLAAIMQQPPPPFRAQVSPELERVVLRALEKQPADRWQSAAQFRAALADTEEGRQRASTEELSRWLVGLSPARDDDSMPTDFARDAEESLPTRTEVAPPREAWLRAPFPLLPAVLLLASSLLALAVGIALSTVPPPPPVPIDPPAVAPAIELPRAQPKEREAPAAPNHEVIRRTPKVVRLPPPDPPPPPPPPIASEPKIESPMRRMLSDLDRTPGNVKLFLELSDQLYNAADALPLEERSAIKAHVDTAKLTMNVTELKRAIDALEKVSPAPR